MFYYVCVCARVRVYVCVCACVQVRVCTCAREAMELLLPKHALLTYFKKCDSGTRYYEVLGEGGRRIHKYF